MITAQYYYANPILNKIQSVFLRFIRRQSSPTMRSHYKRDTEHIQHILNTSKTKAAYSFQKTQRFSPDKSFSPDKIYDIPSIFRNRSISPQQSIRSRTNTNITFSPNRHNLSSSLDATDRSPSKTSTFGISRQEYYQGRSDKIQLGPGSYNIPSQITKKNVYMGRRVERTAKDTLPTCTSYIVTRDSFNKLSTSRNINGAVTMKGEYYPKGKLQAYDNKVPGPGSYNNRGLGKGTSYKETFQRKKANSSFGVGDRMKIRPNKVPAPDYYNRFSQFGITKF